MKNTATKIDAIVTAGCNWFDNMIDDEHPERKLDSHTVNCAMQCINMAAILTTEHKCTADKLREFTISNLQLIIIEMAEKEGCDIDEWGYRHLEGWGEHDSEDCDA